MTDEDILAGTLSLPDDVLKRDVGDELILLHTGSEQYFGLDHMAREMVTGMLENRTGEEVAEEVAGQHDVAPDTVRSDLIGLVRTLLDDDLVDVVLR